MPVIATPLLFSLDVRTGRCLQSCIEVLQGSSIAVQLMKYGFGLVTHTYGVGSDTPAPGPQAQAEAALRAQLVSLSGADILGGVGQLGCATIFSPIQAILSTQCIHDNEKIVFPVPYGNPSFFSIVLPVIDLFNNRILKNFPGTDKIYSVLF